MLSQISNAVASSVDEIVARVVVRRSLRRATRGPSAAHLECREETFFAEPCVARPRLRKVRELSAEGIVVDATWSSAMPTSTFPADGAARLLLHHQPAKKAVLLVHGYLGGRYAFEERIWPTRWLFERGLDVALVTLPCHGARAHGSTSGRFPSSEAHATIEGVRQAIAELRALLGFFETRGTQTGAMGMSLGGYLVALLATVEPRLSFAVPIVPLADLTEFARGRPAIFSTSPTPARELHRVISPLARSPVIGPDRVHVISAAADRIAPPAHARALADHFKAPLTEIRGGHLLQLGRDRAFREIERLLEWSDT